MSFYKRKNIDIEIVINIKFENKNIYLSVCLSFMLKTIIV